MSDHSQYYAEAHIPNERASQPISNTALLKSLLTNRSDHRLLKEISSVRQKAQGPALQGDVVGEIETLKRENLQVKQQLRDREEQAARNTAQVQRQLKVIMEDKRRREQHHQALIQTHQEQSMTLLSLQKWQVEAQSQISRLEEDKHRLINEQLGQQGEQEQLSLYQEDNTRLVNALSALQKEFNMYKHSQDNKVLSLEATNKVQSDLLARQDTSQDMLSLQKEVEALKQENKAKQQTIHLMQQQLHRTRVQQVLLAVKAESGLERESCIRAENTRLLKENIQEREQLKQWLDSQQLEIEEMQSIRAQQQSGHVQQIQEDVMAKLKDTREALSQARSKVEWLNHENNRLVSQLEDKRLKSTESTLRCQYVLLRTEIERLEQQHQRQEPSNDLQAYQKHIKAQADKISEMELERARYLEFIQEYRQLKTELSQHSSQQLLEQNKEYKEKLSILSSKHESLSNSSRLRVSQLEKKVRLQEEHVEQLQNYVQNQQEHHELMIQQIRQNPCVSMQENPPSLDSSLMRLQNQILDL